jgi:hydrogenase assembly chaperone HypC/HupF
MCLSLVGRVRSVDGDEAVVVVDGAERRISLAPLVLTGVVVAPGDWVVAQTGLAVTLLEPEDAEQVLAARRELREETGT